ncbi:MAG TPA: hypothetical protein VM434_20585 [Beijerinckiaceae bacterium]|nr:hypothetical protein [Beijerinckiaceae bacterium]
MRSAALFLLLVLPLGAQAAPWPVHIERQRGETLVIEHTPVPGTVGVRRAHRVKSVVRVRSRAVAPRKAASRHVRRAVAAKRVRVYRYTGVAGGCRDGGLVRYRDPAGQPFVLQREICHGIARLPPGWPLPRRGL